MAINESLLKSEEKAVFSLRSLYSRHGYSQFKMNKFEEYDLYVKNKDFLVSDGIITFTDTNGHLKALKPDVTLSIINNSKDSLGVQKLYYNENVYRISGSTHTYKEIMQAGLECIGQIGNLEVCEVLMLAAKSLETIDSYCCLELSHVGLIEAAFDELQLPLKLRKDVLTCISRKNSDDLKVLCSNNGLSLEVARRLSVFTASYSDYDLAINAVCDTFVSPTANAVAKEFKALIEALKGLTDTKVIVDFSAVGGMSYYSGVVFRGYINNIPDSVLSGGQYDKLMQKLNRTDKAIGFAVYLDNLQLLDRNERPYDVDVVLVCGDDFKTALQKSEELSRNGTTVYTCKAVPENLRYREKITL